MPEFSSEKWKKSLGNFWQLLPIDLQQTLDINPEPSSWKNPDQIISSLKLVKLLKQNKFDEVHFELQKVRADDDGFNVGTAFGVIAALAQNKASLAIEQRSQLIASKYNQNLISNLDDQILSLSSSQPEDEPLARDKGSCLMQEISVSNHKELGRSKMKAASQRYTKAPSNQIERISIEEFIEIKIINLKHREDRWIGIKKHLEEIGFSTVDKYRFDAVGVEGFGELGCTRSHLLAMTEYLCASDKPYLMILEDDFRFKAKANEINEILHWFMDKSRGDVLMMNCSCAMLVPDGNSEGEYTVNRVLSSNSMAGFVIKRGHVRELIGVLLDSLRSHESVGHIYQNLKSQGRREAFRPILNMICNDRVWVNLQTSHRYLTLTPSIGSTVESYSDIESRTVNYRHMEVQ